jgi:hypothetical protein
VRGGSKAEAEERKKIREEKAERHQRNLDHFKDMNQSARVKREEQERKLYETRSTRLQEKFADSYYYEDNQPPVISDEPVFGYETEYMDDDLDNTFDSPRQFGSPRHTGSPIVKPLQFTPGPQSPRQQAQSPRHKQAHSPRQTPLSPRQQAMSPQPVTRLVSPSRNVQQQNQSPQPHIQLQQQLSQPPQTPPQQSAELTSDKSKNKAMKPIDLDKDYVGTSECFWNNSLRDVLLKLTRKHLFDFNAISRRLRIFLRKKYNSVDDARKIVQVDVFSKNYLDTHKNVSPLYAAVAVKNYTEEACAKEYSRIMHLLEKTNEQFGAPSDSKKIRKVIKPTWHPNIVQFWKGTQEASNELL